LDLLCDSLENTLILAKTEKTYEYVNI
jgi:hypothetical protein